MESRINAGLLAGLVAGAVMAFAMMAWNVATGQSPWTTPNLIAAMWLGDAAADGPLSLATAVGFATHMATSGLMGVIAVPFICSLPLGRTLLAASTYALASYPLVFSAVLTWAHPLMIARTKLVPMTLAHLLFGLVLGAVYVRLRASVRAQRSKQFV